MFCVRCSSASKRRIGYCAASSRGVRSTVGLEVTLQSLSEDNVFICDFGQANELKLVHVFGVDVADPRNAMAR
jgi:hypothetical protein